jgi:hypothetical protein
MNWIQSKAIDLLLPYLLGPLVFLVVQGLKKASDAIDRLPVWAKQGVVFVVAQAFVFLQSWSDQSLACGNACTLADIGPEFIKGVLVAASAFLLHFLKQRKPSK